MQPLQVNLNKNKKTILICSDSPHIHTGLARIIRETFRRIHKTGKYNLVQLGWFHISDSEDIPWTVIPTRKLQPSGESDPQDKFGKASLEGIMAKVKPDLVFALRDAWDLAHIPQIVGSSSRIIASVCIDSEPLGFGSTPILQQSEAIIVPTTWARNIIAYDERADTILDKVSVIPYGVDTDIFSVPSQAERDSARRRIFNAAPDDILIGCVAQNHQRKNLGRVLQLAWHLVHGKYATCLQCAKITPYIFAPSRGGAVKATCCEHCGSNDLEQAEPMDNVKVHFHGPAIPILYPEVHSWNLPNLTKTYDLGKEVYLNPELTDKIGVHDKTLAQVYKCLDIFTLASTCEGFGLPVLEAMSCGVPCVLPDYSAHTEFASGASLLVSNERYIEPRIDAIRVQVHMADYLGKTLQLIKNKSLRQEKGKAARAIALSLNWDIVTGQVQDLIDKVLDNPIQDRITSVAI